jgi:hypothetical protein
MTVPGGTWAWIEPVVPTRTIVRIPNCANSFTTIEVDGPPMPDVHDSTGAPSSVPR